MNHEMKVQLQQIFADLVVTEVWSHKPDGRLNFAGDYVPRLRVILLSSLPPQHLKRE